MKKRAMPPKRKAMKSKEHPSSAKRGMTVQPDGSMQMSPPADRRGAVVPVKHGAKKKSNLGRHKGY